MKSHARCQTFGGLNNLKTSMRLYNSILNLEYYLLVDASIYFNSFKPGVLFVGHIGKQHSPRCDAAERGVPSGAILFAWRNFIEK